MVSAFRLFWHEQNKRENEVEISLLPQNDQFLSEICDGHLVLDNRGQRQKIYEGGKNKNILKKISTMYADNMENYKIACLSEIAKIWGRCLRFKRYSVFLWETMFSTHIWIFLESYWKVNFSTRKNILFLFTMLPKNSV